MKLREINQPGELGIDNDLIDRFTNKGWEIIGEGRDQIVLGKSKNRMLLKIVGFGSLPRQAMIRKYITFFRDNQRNPHFPRVGVDRTLQWKGRQYYAYTQERLSHMSGDEAVLDYIQDVMSRVARDESPDYDHIPAGLTAEQIDGLVMAIESMFRAGLGQSGFDLANVYNLMQRKNGQLVIVDPYSSWDDELEEDVVEKINTATLEPDFKITRRMRNGLIIRARGKKRFADMPNNIGIEIEIFDPEDDPDLRWPVADSRFNAKQDPDTGEWYLSSLSTGTKEKYRRRGLASAMYNFARMLGNDLRPSRLQTRAGEDFWKKGGAGQGRSLDLDDEPVMATAENFDDGQKPGRKGLAKRMGVDCSKSVTDLRKIAKNSSGERQRMAHWCANMKSGRKG